MGYQNRVYGFLIAGIFLLCCGWLAGCGGSSEGGDDSTGADSSFSLDLDLTGSWMRADGTVLELDQAQGSYYLYGGPDRTRDDYEAGTYVKEGAKLTFTVTDDHDGVLGIGDAPGDSITYEFLVFPANRMYLYSVVGTVNVGGFAGDLVRVI